MTAIYKDYAHKNYELQNYHHKVYQEKMKCQNVKAMYQKRLPPVPRIRKMETRPYERMNLPYSGERVNSCKIYEERLKNMEKKRNEKNRQRVLITCGVTLVILFGTLIIFRKVNSVKIKSVRILNIEGCHKSVSEIRATMRLLNAQRKANELMNLTVSAPAAIAQPQATVLSRMGTSKAPHLVKSHVRNLPVGWKASAEKIAAAAELGCTLGPNQTLVCDYVTGKLVS